MFILWKPKSLWFHLKFGQENGFTTTGLQFPGTIKDSGVVHGGIVAALLDEVMSHSLENAGIEAVTGTLKPSIKPLLTEKPLTARGQVVKEDGRVIEAQGEVIQEGEW